MTDQKELRHYGVLGMKWGVRRRSSSDSIPDGEAKAVQKKPGTKVVGEGGRKVPAHDDAVRAARAKQIAKNSTTDALSNKELQDLVTRLNLEQQYSKLINPQNKGNQNSLQKGMKTVNQVLEAKKAYDTLTKDPFIREAVEGIKEDLGINNLIRKGAGKAAGAAFKPR